MSDNDIFEIDEDDGKVFIPKSKNKANKNKKKAKAAMTDERKAKLLEQLARGRATSALNRGKKAKLKQIKKQDEITEQDELIYKDIEKKKNKKTKREMELEAELESLKKKQRPLSPIKEDDEETAPYTLQNPEPPKKVYPKKTVATNKEENIKIKFDEKTKRIKDDELFSDQSTDDEEIEKQIQKLQSKKKLKKQKSSPQSSSIQKPQNPNVNPVIVEKPRKPKAWEISHLW